MKNDTKEMIRQAAVSEFMDKGFAGASLRQIVKNAGVTTGAFYKYYPTKEALLAELVEEHAEHIYNIYDEILADFEELFTGGADRPYEGDFPGRHKRYARLCL